jgi:hypothetical protein
LRIKNFEPSSTKTSKGEFDTKTLDGRRVDNTVRYDVAQGFKLSASVSEATSALSPRLLTTVRTSPGLLAVYTAGPIYVGAGYEN